QLNQPDKALADLRQAIAKGFNNVEQMKNDPKLAPLRTREDFGKLLAAEYTKAIELKPDNWQAWHQRGQVYGQLGQWDKALADYFKAIELAKDNETLAALVRKHLETDFAKALQA